MVLTDSNKHVRLEVGDLLRGLADEVVHLVVGDAEVLGLGHRGSSGRIRDVKSRYEAERGGRGGRELSPEKS